MRGVLPRNIQDTRIIITEPSSIPSNGEIRRNETTLITPEEISDSGPDLAIALARNDYAANDLDAVVQGLGITDPQTQKLVLKKLKGDYAKDRALLESVGCHGEMEEELDAIREELNRRMVDRYFASDLVDRDEIRKSVYIEDSLSITLTANNEG